MGRGGRRVEGRDQELKANFYGRASSGKPKLNETLSQKSGVWRCRVKYDFNLSKSEISVNSRLPRSTYQDQGHPGLQNAIQFLKTKTKGERKKNEGLP